MSWKLWSFMVGGVALGALVWSGQIDRMLGAEEHVPPVAAEVNFGTFAVSVVERGNLKAANSIELKSELEGQSTILFLMDEGSMVSAGELIVELDATGLVEKRVSQEITVQNAHASWVKATQNLEIQRSKNESDIAKAKRTRSFAEIDKKKYLQGDWLIQKQEARDNILIAEEELKRADDTLLHSKGLFEKDFLTRTEFEADELAKKRREIALEQTRRHLTVLVDYDHPRRLEELEADMIEAEREILRVELESAARLVDYDAEVRSSKARVELETSKLQRYGQQIAKARIHAPVAGMVVHAQPAGGGHRGKGEPLAEGSSVRERQNLITIPSSEGMIADVSLHESVLEKVQLGMACSVTVDALPGVVLPGEVRFKAVMADSNSWFGNPNTRLYRTSVAVLESDERLRPGMSCSIEIHVEEIEDTLFVPVQTVFADGAERVCFVVEPSGKTVKRPVEVGSFSGVWAQILSGVKLGERVSLSLPVGQSLAPAPREFSKPKGPAVPSSAGEGNG